MRIQGISGSRGVAVGNVYRYIQEEIVIPDYTVAEDKVEAEIGKFAAAMASTLKQLDTITAGTSFNKQPAYLQFARRRCRHGHASLASRCVCGGWEENNEKVRSKTNPIHQLIHEQS